jgi:hypothetical protein
MGAPFLTGWMQATSSAVAAERADPILKSDRGGFGLNDDVD